MSDATIGFAVVYRWRLHDEKTEQFRAAWETVTLRLMRDRGALGSRLHRAGDGTWVAYAQWRSRADWEAARSAAPVDVAAFDTMRDATVEAFEPVLLAPVCDHLRPSPIAGT
jgi:quinol monooxygenase YgiN